MRKAREEAGRSGRRNAGQESWLQINARGAIEWEVKITLYHSKNGHLGQFVKITQAQNFPKYYDELPHKASWDRNRLSCREGWEFGHSRSFKDPYSGLETGFLSVGGRLE